LANSILWWGLIRHHDEFFKWVMSQPGVAEALLEFVLPPDLRRLWNGTALVPLSGSLITQKLEERRTDCGYLCPSPPGTSPPLLVVFEHKSAPDRETPWQVTQYLYEQVRGFVTKSKDQPRRARNPLPLATAVVVYQGKWPWRVPLSLVAAMAADGRVPAHIFSAGYLLIDVLRTPIELLPPVPRLRVAFMIWQFDRKSPGSLKERLVELARATLALGIDDLTAMVYYLWGEADGRGAALLGEVLDEVVPGRREQIMQTVGEQLVARGRALGLVEGEVKGRAEGLVEGEAKGRREMLLRQLHRRFGEIRGDVVERIRVANIKQLDDWIERFVDARTLEDVFGADRRH